MTESKRTNGHKVQTSEGKRERIRKAVFIEDFAFETLKEMRENLSFEGESARDSAAAVSAIGKLWDAAQERIRVLKGEPQPGQKRPLPEVKKEKPKKLNRPPPSLAPAKVAPDHAA